MKTTLKLFALSLLGLLFVVPVQAQVNPAITKAYSNEQIDKMVNSYNTAHSRDVIPSAALQQKFQADFPNARDIDWETAMDVYEVEFEIKMDDYKAYYDAQGNLLMYSYEIRESQLPAIIKNAALNKYPKYRFEDIKKIQKGSDVFYKIEMERKDMDVKMVFKSDGTVVDQWID